jgi:hypothetical protein
VSKDDRLEAAREMYRAFAAGDRAGYFERCWPGAGQGQAFSFVRLLAAGDEVIVTYEMTARDGRRGRNTEVLTFRGDEICRAEVYFGWNVE